MWRARLVGFGAMVAGFVIVIGAMVWMNNRVADRDQDDGVATIQFEVKQNKPEPPKPRPRPKPPPRPRRAEAPPTPTLGASLAGLSFGLPQFQTDLSDMTESLVGDVGDVVMTESAVDRVPQPLERVEPDYPPRARAKGLQGEVTVSLLIGPDGRVKDVRVLDASQPGVFDEAVVTAFEKWRFAAPTYQGRPVTARFDTTYSFVLR